jgi:hypothetical protein
MITLKSFLNAFDTKTPQMAKNPLEHLEYNDWTWA